SLYADCRALIYPQEEDFGIIAVEAQAMGRPVIAFGRGGALDTVRCWESPGSAGEPDRFASGVHFTPQTPEALLAALDTFERHACEFEPKKIREWSTQFGIDRFHREFRQEVEKTLEVHRRP
ncbi:MAG: glycosyltransferase family 4 protein, partial [bacterium]|nr:glycosyltransferase family 4 protein [bacterium]